MWIKPEDL
jgi:hypothetical protein